MPMRGAGRNSALFTVNALLAMREAGEGGLAVLAESDVFVRLELLEPGTEIELMLAVRPTTSTAPTGFPSRNPGTSDAGVPGVGSPVKKYPAREKPKRATFSRVGEKTCVHSKLSTCSCRLKMSVL